MTEKGQRIQWINVVTIITKRKKLVLSGECLINAIWHLRKRNKLLLKGKKV